MLCDFGLNHLRIQVVVVCVCILALRGHNKLCLLTLKGPASGLWVKLSEV